MSGRNFRIATIAGIPVGISPWWLLVVALITWSLGASFYPSEVPGIGTAAAYGLGLASALLLFASILAHEFGHAVTARRRGMTIDEIDLWLLGGVARISGHPRRARDEFDFAIAGPIVTAMIAAAFGIAAVTIPHSAPAALRALIVYEAEINVLILVFNLVPAFPLDGGRMLRAYLWDRRGDLTAATETASRIGRGFGFGLIAFGVLIAFSGFAGGLWFSLIGVFLVAASGAARMQQQMTAALAGVRAEALMSTPVISIPDSLSLAEAATEYFAPHRYTSFPVTDAEGRALGLLTIEQLERSAADERARIRVGELADRDPGLIIERDQDVADLLERAAFARVGRAVVVDELLDPIGIVSVTDVQRVMRAVRIGSSDRSVIGPVRH